MNHNENAFVIYLKVQSLVTSIKNYFNLSYRESLKLLYYSKLYKALELTNKCRKNPISCKKLVTSPRF